MTTPRVDPFADLAGLANRIAQQLKANPKDAQVRADLRYIRSLMPQAAKNVSATDTPPQAPVDQQIKAGLTAIPGDLARGVGTSIMHPIQTLGQLTGLANRENLRATAQDPEASIPEKLDALMRATPLNAGYAPFRAFLESTGAKSDEPALLSEQVRQGGDIAAGLALMRANPAKIPGATMRTIMRIIPRWVKEIQPRVSAALGSEAAPETVTGVTEAAIRSRLSRQGFSPENVEQLMATWRNGGKPAPISEPPAPPVLRPGETVEQIAPNGFAIKGPRVTPPPPTTPTVTEILQGRGQTLPYYPRGGMVEQSIAPPPSQAPVQLSPNQNAAFIEFLKGASSPQEQAARVGTLKALGVLPGPNDEAQLLQILGAR